MDEDITAAPLLPAVEAATARALDSGALGPIETREETVDDGGWPFRLRTVAGLARKEAAQTRARENGFDRDPFLPPYEPGLYVGPVPPHHAGLLNKFPVLEHHLLIVTREWQSQDEALTAGDCEALLRALAAGAGLAFFNGGEEAGASQPHRHLQWVPLAEPAPLEAAVAEEAPLPFPVAREPLPAAWLADPAASAAACHAAYARLLAAIDRAPGGRVPERPAPYNLLATRDGLWAVPRVCGSVGGVAINALGYAGLMLAADAEQARWIRAEGPMRLLVRAAGR